MSEIDWSKAPEGAEFYCPKGYGYYEGWVKQREDGVYGFCHFGKNSWAWGCGNSHLSRPGVIQKPAWTGDGLPPVGTVCWVRRYSGQDSPYEGECEVIAHHMNGENPVAVYVRGPAKSMYVSMAMESCFSPLRTQAQIEAEEREKALIEIEELIAGYTYGKCAELIYDAGYRKQGEAK